MNKNISPFKLSKTNWIFSITVIVLFSILFLIKDGLNSYSLGYISGTIITAAIIPLALAFIVWLIRGRIENAGTTTFNIILLLMCFGMIREIGDMKSVRENSVEKITNSASEYKQRVLGEEDAIDAFEEHSTIMNDNLSKLISNSTGNDQIVYMRLRDFFNLNKEVMIQWQMAYDSVLNPRILDYGILNTDDEFNYQISVLKNYSKNSVIYKDHFLRRKEIIRELFDKIPKSNQTFRGVMVGINKKDSLQAPIFVPFIDAHISYGKNLTELISFLEQSRNKWTYSDDQISFDNVTLEQEYREIYTKIASDESRINQLVDELYEVM